jgi:hypothetical protein
MSGLLRDWKRWTLAERCVAALLLVGAVAAQLGAVL